jgi:hypothetical protein
MGRLEEVRIGPLLGEGIRGTPMVAGRLIEREHKVEKGTRRLVAIITVVGALALAPAAFAQSSGTGYGGQAGGVAGATQNGSNNSGVAGTKTSNPTAATQASTGNGVLAFTGLDLALLAGGGLVLLASGVALSRLVGRHSAA